MQASRKKLVLAANLVIDGYFITQNIKGGEAPFIWKLRSGSVQFRQFPSIYASVGISCGSNVCLY